MSDLSYSSSEKSAEIAMEKSLVGKKMKMDIISTSADAAAEEQQHEAHSSSSERERRRKKMGLHMKELEYLVPSLHDAQADEPTIADDEETMKYIKTLADVIKKLEKIKKERLLEESASDDIDAAAAANPNNGGGASSSSSMPPADTSALDEPLGFKTWVFPNVMVSICEGEAQFSMCFPNNEELYGATWDILRKYKIKVLSVSIKSNDTQSTYKIQAVANEENSEEAISFEETCKEAAREIYFLSPNFLHQGNIQALGVLFVVWLKKCSMEHFFFF